MTSNKTLILYHGTTSKYLKRILREGIKPRNETKLKSNWDGQGIPSRPDLVYLTTCYAAYYASMATTRKCDKSVVFKLEINPDEMTLLPDEEFIYNALRTNAKIKHQEKSIENLKMSDIDPNEYNLGDNWKQSLNYLGTVSAKFIPRKFIKGYALENGIDFLLHCDPSISFINYQVCSQQYIKHLESLKYQLV